MFNFFVSFPLLGIILRQYVRVQNRDRPESCSVSLQQIYARPAVTAAGHTRYAANITGSILSFYESHFEVDYLPKKLGEL